VKLATLGGNVERYPQLPAKEQEAASSMKKGEQNEQ
jgi:hypothetical protein